MEFDITDLDIQALVDNELDEDMVKKVRAAIAANPRVEERYNELTKQKDLLRQWYRSSKIN